ncbi:MAG: type II secretion system protein GspK [Methylococcaceae bacterium]
MIQAKGFALVLVLWVLSLLTIMAGSFALSMRREAAIVTGLSHNAQATAVAESGLAVAELMLLNPDQQQRWRTDGSIYQIDYTDAQVRIRLVAETGKIDLNAADQTLLEGLMTYAPVETEEQTKLVNAILDWRDEDDLVHIDGAEKDEYKKAGLSYQPRNKPFQSVEELQLVLGMNEQVFNWLENRVTVYSAQPKVDLTQATKEVLQVLPGMDGGSIDSYIAARRESAINGLPAPVFGVSVASQPGADTEIDSTLNTAVNDGTIQAGMITVVSDAVLVDGSTANIKALIIKAEGAKSSPFQIQKWLHNAVGEGSLFADEKDELLVRQYGEPEFNN